MRMKRGITRFLCCVSVLCFLVPHLAWAEEEGSGSGTVSTGNMARAEMNTLNGPLDFTTDRAEKETDQYSWKGNDTEGYVLTLKNVCVKGTETDGVRYALKLPRDCPQIVIKTDGQCTLEGGIDFPTSTSAAAYHLIFDGASLVINGSTSSNTNGEQITVQNGANVELAGHLNLGGSGNQQSIINVTGKDSKLTLDGEGKDDICTIANLKITDGSMLCANCPLMIIDHIEVGNEAIIEIKAKPTIFSQDSGGNQNKDVLKPIADYLTEEYHLGEGTVEYASGDATYYTVLDQANNVASEITLYGPNAPRPEPPTSESPSVTQTPSESSEENPSVPSQSEAPTESEESSASSGNEESSDPSESESSSATTAPPESSVSGNTVESTTPEQTRTETAGSSEETGPSASAGTTATVTTATTAGTDRKPSDKGTTAGGSGAKPSAASSQEAAVDPDNQNGRPIVKLDETPHTGDPEDAMVWILWSMAGVALGSLAFRWHKKFGQDEI